MVDKNGAFRHTGKSPICAEYHAAQIVVIANATKNDFGLGYGLAWGGCMVGTARGIGKLGTPGLCFGGSTVVNRDLMASASQMAGHGETHHAQAQKGNTAGRRGFVVFGVQAAHKVASEDWVENAKPVI
jgi:hypothetical protein